MGYWGMNQYIKAGIVISVVFIFTLPSLALAYENADGQNKFIFKESYETEKTADPTYFRGVILGRIKNPHFESNGWYGEVLSFYAINVRYFGHYYGFGSGFERGHYINENVSIPYYDGHFRGLQTDNIICGVFDTG